MHEQKERIKVLYKLFFYSGTYCIYLFIYLLNSILPCRSNSHLRIKILLSLSTQHLQAIHTLSKRYNSMACDNTQLNILRDGEGLLKPYPLLPLRIKDRKENAAMDLYFPSACCTIPLYLAGLMPSVICVYWFVIILLQTPSSDRLCHVCSSTQFNLQNCVISLKGSHPPLPRNYAWLIDDNKEPDF